MKTLVPFFLLLNCLSFSVQAQNQKETVLFDYDRYILTADAQSKLDAVLSKMILSDLQSVVLNGNTDADGNSNYNVTLSKNRANTVADYLITKGIPSEKIRRSFEGENKPVAENESNSGKQQNRRVEITFAFTEKNYTNTVYEQFPKEIQPFTAKSNEVISITGKEGTVIRIPKNALVKSNGKYAVGKIDIELQEFYKKSDVLKANLHTMSDGKMLESGGMIYIKATAKGETLQLKKGAEMDISFASKNKPDNMEVFYGYPKKDKSIDWNTNSELAEEDDVIETSGTAIYTITYWNGNVVSDTLKDGITTRRFKRDDADTKKVALIDNTILKSSKLGWINCDRFYDVKDKTNLAVAIDLKYKPEIRLVFKDINSIMAGYLNADKQLVFANVPVGRKATLLAFSYVNDEAYISIKDVVIDKGGIVALDLRKTGMEELKTELEKLNE